MAAFAKSDKCIRPGQGLADSFGVHDMQYIYTHNNTKYIHYVQFILYVL